MSITSCAEPECREYGCPPAVETVIAPRTKDLGELEVRRVLPSRLKRMVGPFLFFDEMGPVVFPPGKGVDVRPHPHIHLATVTYLFEGEILHRDSLGSLQAIRPGAVNWMTAGRGIVHSERTSAERLESGGRLHGLQLWLALPEEKQDIEPAFRHYPGEDLPVTDRTGARLRVMIGSAYGETSPVETVSPTFYVDADLEPGAELPLPEEHDDRAVYVVQGAVSCEGVRYESRTMIVFRTGARAALKAEEACRVVILGGEPFAEPRHMWWNFVSTDKANIERAKRDWAEGRFPRVPGDEEEFIPLPE